MKTLKNKVTALLLIACGVIPIMIDGDATVFVFNTCVAIPLFFAKKNWMTF